MCRRIIPLLIVALLASACGGTETPEPRTLRVRDGAAPQDSNQADRATQDAADSPETLPMADTSPSEQVADAGATTELNDGAPFDQFIIDTFAGTVAPAELGVVSLFVSSHCLGGILSADDMRQAAAEDVVREITAIDETTCDSYEMSPVLLRAEPTNAATWDEIVATRFQRTIWWDDLAAFDARARTVCTLRESSFALQSDRTLSLSVTLELSAMIDDGDCDRVPGVSSDVVTVTAPAASGSLDTSGVALVRHHDRDRTTTDLGLFDLSTGENVMITQHFDTMSIGRVTVSPDGTTIAFVADKRIGDEVVELLELMSVDGSNRRELHRLRDGYSTSLVWSADADEIFFNDVDPNDDDRRLLYAVDVATGDVRMVAEPRDGWSQYLIGATPDGLVTFQSDGWTRDYHLLDTDSGSEIVSYPTEVYGNNGSLSPQGDVLPIILKPTRNIEGELAFLEGLDEGRMTLNTVPTVPGLPLRPSVSPDGQRFMYMLGGQFDAQRLFVVEMSDPSSRIDVPMPADADIGAAYWRDDSASLVVSMETDSRNFTERSHFVVALDGSHVSIGDSGTIVAVLDDIALPSGPPDLPPHWTDRIRAKEEAEAAEAEARANRRVDAAQLSAELATWCLTLEHYWGPAEQTSDLDIYSPSESLDYLQQFVATFSTAPAPPDVEAQVAQLISGYTAATDYMSANNASFVDLLTIGDESTIDGYQEARSAERGLYQYWDTECFPNT